MKRIGLVTAGVLGGLAAATTFLCAMPDQRYEGGPAAGRDALAVSQPQRTIVSHAIFVGEPASYGPRSNRHAFDAARAGAAGKSQGEDLGWDYVQLRL